MVRRKYVCNPKIYKEHYGRGLNTAFVGDIVQEGYGLGGFLSSLVRKAIPIVMPFLKSAAKTVGKTLVKRGADVFKDVVIEKKNLKSSLKRHAESGLDDILQNIAKQTGKGHRKKACKIKRKKVSVNRDIFS